MAWQHSPHRLGALLILSLRQSYLRQNRPAPVAHTSRSLQSAYDRADDRSSEDFRQGQAPSTHMRARDDLGHPIAGVQIYGYVVTHFAPDRSIPETGRELCVLTDTVS